MKVTIAFDGEFWVVTYQLGGKWDVRKFQTLRTALDSIAEKEVIIRAAS